MTKNDNDKKVNVDNRKSNSIDNVQRGASPVKIAYYVQKMLEKNMETKEIILIISSQFDNDDIREFAKMYRYCFYREDIRRIANLIYNISRKSMNDAIQTVVRDISTEKEMPSEYYIRENSSSQQKKINIKVL